MEKGLTPGTSLKGNFGSPTTEAVGSNITIPEPTALVVGARTLKVVGAGTNNLIFRHNSSLI